MEECQSIDFNIKTWLAQRKTFTLDFLRPPNLFVHYFATSLMVKPGERDSLISLLLGRLTPHINV